jgi:hypothetical protein
MAKIFHNTWSWVKARHDSASDPSNPSGPSGYYDLVFAGLFLVSVLVLGLTPLPSGDIGILATSCWTLAIVADLYRMKRWLLRHVEYTDDSQSNDSSQAFIGCSQAGNLSLLNKVADSHCYDKKNQ